MTLQIYPSGDKNNCVLAVVTDMPTKLDVSDRTFLTGPVGKMVKQMLLQQGISWNQVYCTSLFKEYPSTPSIEISHKKQKAPFIQHNSCYVTPQYLLKEEQLLKELSSIKATTIIALGEYPMYALTGLTGISNRRGSVYFNEEIQKKIIPVHHPNSIFKEFELSYIAAHDYKRAVEESKTFDLLKDQQTTLIIKPSFFQCLQYIESCNTEQEIGFDTEWLHTEQTGKFQDSECSCLSLSKKDGTAICIPFLDEQMQDYFNPDQETQIWLALQFLLTNKHVTKIIQNSMFDCSIILKKYGIIIEPVEDTMIAAGILYADFKKNLGFLTSLYTKEQFYKDEGKQHKKITDPNRFWRYSAKDALVLLPIWSAQEIELVKMKNLSAYRNQLKVCKSLLIMQTAGIQVSTEERDAVAISLQEEIRIATEKLQESLPNINPNSPAQLKEHFYRTLGYKPRTRKNKDTGEVKETTDESALIELAAEGCKEASLVLELRHLNKLNSTYIQMPLDTDNRLRCSFNPVGTNTGRLSSSKTIFGTGGNLQNLPKKFSIFVKADPMCIMYGPDLSQAENRIVAHIAPEPSMMRAFKEGIDIHSLTAGKIAGIDPVQIKEQNTLFEETKDPKYCAPIGAGNKPWRYWGKQANHSLDYDVGISRFSRKLEISEADGKFIKEGFMRSYPGIGNYHRWVTSLLSGTRELSNCFNRVKRFYGRPDYTMFQAGYAYIPQSTVADIINRWGLNYITDHGDEFNPVLLLNQIHDSIVFEISTRYDWETHARILLLLRKSLEQTITFKGISFNIPCDFSAGLSMGKLSGIKVITNDVDTTAKNIENLYKQLTQKDKQ